jgi:hypothetical protein
MVAAVINTIGGSVFGGTGSTLVAYDQDGALLAFQFEDDRLEPLNDVHITLSSWVPVPLPWSHGWPLPTLLKSTSAQQKQRTHRCAVQTAPAQ